MINYNYIEDLLSVNYPIIRCVDQDRNIMAIRVNVSSISKYKHLDFIRGLFAGNGLNISYDNNREFVEIKIPD